MSVHPSSSSTVDDVFGIRKIQHSPSITTLSFVKGGQQHQVASNMKGISRVDDIPGIKKIEIGEDSDACRTPTQQHYVSVSVDQTPNITRQNNVAAQRQNINQSQWRPQYQQDRSFAQELSKRHSMDLITTRTTAVGHTYTNNELQNSLFHSSSHHTAHTAAAGDLLSMSRSALDASLPDDPSNVITKKRSATMVDDIMCDVGGACDGSSSTAVQLNMSKIVQHLAAHAPQLNSQSTTIRSFVPSIQDTHYFNINTQMQSSLTSTSTCVSSPIVDATDGNNDQSYLNHRTIRRCLRSDSFEMMDDC